MNRCQKSTEPKSRQLFSLSAFVAYLGFLNVLVAHSHPVMLVFCHLLINRNSDSGIEELLPQIMSFGASREQGYGEGMLCFCQFLFFFLVVCQMSIDPRNIKTRKIKLPACLFFSQWTLLRPLSGTPVVLKYL